MKTYRKEIKIPEHLYLVLELMTQEYNINMQSLILLLLTQKVKEKLKEANDENNS